jgi:FkbM family methyltransferase
MRQWLQTIADTGDAAAVLDGILNSEEYRQRQLTENALQQARQALIAKAGPVFENRPITIVDVGAQELEGESHVYSELAADLPCRIIGFEPLEHRLQQSLSHTTDNRVQLFPTCIGDGGRHAFHINNDDATSSLLPLNADLTQDLLDLCELRTERIEPVATSTLDEVLASCARVDFLKLDIQGFELPVLRHARNALSRTNVVHCEVGFAEIYRGQALFPEVELELRSQGFEFLDFSFACRYPYRCNADAASRDRLGWADAVFFRKSQAHDAQEDVLARILIALFVYGKYSLAVHLAERHDAATGSQLARWLLEART